MSLRITVRKRNYLFSTSIEDVVENIPNIYKKYVCILKEDREASFVLIPYSYTKIMLFFKTFGITSSTIFVDENLVENKDFIIKRCGTFVEVSLCAICSNLPNVFFGSCGVVWGEGCKFNF